MWKRLLLLIPLLLTMTYAQNIFSCEHNFTTPKYYELIVNGAKKTQQADFVFQVPLSTQMGGVRERTLKGKAILEFKLGENRLKNERWFLVELDQDLETWRGETYHGEKVISISFHGYFLVVANRDKNSLLANVHHLVSGYFGQNSVIGTPDGKGAVYDLIAVELAKEEAGLANHEFNEFWHALRNYLKDIDYKIWRLPPLPQHLKIVDDQNRLSGKHIVRREPSRIFDLLALSKGIPRKLEKKNIYYCLDSSNNVAGGIDIYSTGDGGCFRYRAHEPVANIAGDIQQTATLLKPKNSFEAKYAAKALLENTIGFRRKAREIYRAKATAEQWDTFLAAEKQAQKDLTQLINNTNQEGTALSDLEAFQLFKNVVTSSVFNHLTKDDDLGSPALEVLAKVIKGGMPSRRLKGQGKKVSYLFVAYRRGKYIYPFAYHEKKDERILAHLQFIDAYAPGLMAHEDFVKNYIRGGRVDLFFDEEGQVEDVVLSLNGFFVPPGKQLDFDDQKKWLPLLKKYFQNLFNQ